MVVKLAKTAGFCMGVKRAVDIVLDRARSREVETIYTYGPLIHNPQTIQILKKRGIVPVDAVDDIAGGVIIIRAHGISPDEREKIKSKGVRIIDATCPKVAHVQSIIKKHSSLGYTIVIVGDRTHPEVVGLRGYSSGRGLVVGSVDEVGEIPCDGPVCVVAQTTQNSETFAAIAARISERFPGAVIVNTVCDSTERRQSEVRALAGEMDAIIIVGGKNSANTQQLASIARSRGAPTFHIETVEELAHINLDPYGKIGVSAGASTPNWITDSVIDYLTHCHEKKGPRNLRDFYRLWIFLIQTDIYSALGAGCLAVASMFLQRMEVQPLSVLIACFYVYAVHTINRLRERNFGRIQGSFREELYVKRRDLFYGIAFACLVIAAAMSWMAGPAPFALLVLLAVLGVLYNITIFPAGWRLRRLSDIPGSKSVSIALAWATITALLPQAGVSSSLTPATAVAFLFVWVLVFVKSTLDDMVDIQSDRLVGEETIPVLIGEGNTRRLLEGVSMAMGLILVCSPFAGFTPGTSAAFVLCVFYVWICFMLYDRKARFSSVVLEGLLGINYLLAGIISAVLPAVG